MTSVNTAKEHIQGQRGKNTSLKADVRIDGHDQREKLSWIVEKVPSLSVD